MTKNIKDIILRKREEMSFLVLLSFLPTFVIARLYVYLAMRFDWNIFVVIKGVHIHHLSYGIIILALAGYWALINPNQRRFIALIYGVGLALSFDEFGMWLHLEDNYWLRQSYDAVILITALLLNIIFLKKFWKTAWRIFCSAFLVGRAASKKEQIAPDGESRGEQTLYL